MEKIKTFIKGVCYSTKWSFEASPVLYIIQIILKILGSIIPYIIIWNWKNVINFLTDQQKEYSVSIMIAIYVLAKVIEKVVLSFSQYIKSIQGEILVNYVDCKLMNKIVDIDVSYFDSPEYQNESRMVSMAAWRSKEVSNNVFEIIGSLINTIVAIVLLMKIYPWAGVIMVAVYVPYAIIQYYNERADADRTRYFMNETRKKDYYMNIMTGKDYAKELRLYNIGENIKNRYFDLWDNIQKSHRKMIMKNSIKSTLAAIFSYVGLIIIFSWTAIDALNGKVTIGDVQYNVAIAVELMEAMSVLVMYVSFTMSHCLNYIEPYNKFINLQNKLSICGVKEATSMPKITFKNVSFKYPNTDKSVLKNLNFTINPGEKISLVGVNGAGKSTIVKLMLRFYDPLEGSILIDDVDAKEYDIVKLRKKFGVLFQDYQQYSFSLKENIILSDLENNKDEERILRACQMSGVDKIINDFEDGLSTPLTRVFDDNGKELSGGQWQKVALARTFFHNPDIIILDEPSASLDAEAEDKVFHSFMDLCENKSALLISHRLYNLKGIDKILLIENGQVIEEGTHEELVKLNGRYAYLFNLQASKYIKLDKNEVLVMEGGDNNER